MALSTIICVFKVFHAFCILCQLFLGARDASPLPKESPVPDTTIVILQVVQASNSSFLQGWVSGPRPSYVTGAGGHKGLMPGGIMGDAFCGPQQLHESRHVTIFRL